MYYIRKEIFNPLKVADAESVMREFSRADAALYRIDQNNVAKGEIPQKLAVQPCRSGRSLSLAYGKDDVPGGAPGGGSAAFLQTVNKYTTHSGSHLEISSHRQVGSTHYITTDESKWVDLELDVNFTTYEYMPLLAMISVQYKSTISGEATGAPFATDRPCSLDIRISLDGDPQGCIASPTNRGDSDHAASPGINPMFLHHSFMHTFSSAPGSHTLSAQIRDRSITGEQVASSDAPNNYAAVDQAVLSVFGIAR